MNRKARVRRVLTAASLLSCIFIPAQALDNGLALTPPMGWNPWNALGGRSNDAAFRATADSMASKGLLAAGYIYMNEDGGGSYPDQKGLADYVHGKGFKFGTYGNNVNYTTPESVWVANWVSYGSDYVKWDAYNSPWTDPTFTKMRDLIAASGRHIVLSQHCSGETVNSSTPGLANLWRTTPDIYLSGETPSYTKALMNIATNNGYAASAGPGHWNDPDFLIIGLKNTLSDDMEKAHFSLWAISAAPLIIGCDVRTIRQSSLNILLNTEVIAIDQDSLGYQGRIVMRNAADMTTVWTKNLKNGDRALLLYNGSTVAKQIVARWKDIGMVGDVAVRDLWAHADSGMVHDSLVIRNIPPNGCAMFRLTGQTVEVEPRLSTAPQLAPRQQGAVLFNPLDRLTSRAVLTSAAWFDLQGRAAAWPVIVAPANHQAVTSAAPPVILVGPAPR